MRRLDLYAECNVGGMAVDEFASYCARCVNPECVRSSAGSSKFDLRVKTWEDRLFFSVPRMDPADPRYQGISAQSFIAINPPLGNVRSDWVDPKAPAASPAAHMMAPAPAPEPLPVVEPDPEPPQEPETSPVAAEPPQEPLPTTEPKSPAKPTPNLGAINTPAKQGQMITPRKSEVEAPASDWSRPVPKAPKDEPEVRIVKPGEKIRLGS